MKKNTAWEVLSDIKISLDKDQKKEYQKLIDILLANRGLTTAKEKTNFLHPDIALVTPDAVGIDVKQADKTVKRIQKAIDNKEQVIVFGDYDVDGIAGTAIVWETLTAVGARIMPYIPSRVDEGYGLSQKGIEHVVQQYPNTSLIITVDNGIVAHTAVDFANTKGIDVIITDHHVPSSVLPKAHAIFHSTKLCGTGVAWLLSHLIHTYDNDHLALVALATVADLVPLQQANRTVLIEGLRTLHTTKRPGIVALCEESGISQKEIGVYEIGHILAPRINAMGRISHAMESLRLLCTKDRLKAKVLAEKLGITNKERQELTKSLSQHAIGRAKEKKSNLLFLAHESYDEGVIGLVAGKLIEVYYRPSIVVAIGEKISKASARSVAGFNVIQFIRQAEHLLINAGGHPMAAGFSVETERIGLLEEFLTKKIIEDLPETLLIRKRTIDCEIPLAFVSQQLYTALQILSPFGMGNPEPTFVSRATIVSIKKVGKDGGHLSLVIASEAKRLDSLNPRNGVSFSAIAFGMGEKGNELQGGNDVQIVYTIDEHEWNNKKSLQLKIKDIKTT